MIEIDTNLLKKMRERTNLPLIICKRYLLEAKNDLEEAIKLARWKELKHGNSIRYRDCTV